jgi:hypothetical protein
MNSRHDSLSGMGRRAGKARLMRDRQRDGEDDLGSDHEVNLSRQGRFPFEHFQSGLLLYKPSTQEYQIFYRVRIKVPMPLCDTFLTANGRSRIDNVLCLCAMQAVFPGSSD